MLDFSYKKTPQTIARTLPTTSSQDLLTDHLSSKDEDDSELVNTLDTDIPDGNSGVLLSLPFKQIVRKQQSTILWRWKSTQIAPFDQAKEQKLQRNNTYHHRINEKLCTL